MPLWALRIPVSFPSLTLPKPCTASPLKPPGEGWTGPGPGRRPEALRSSNILPFPEAGLNGMNSSIWEHFASGSFSPGTSPAFLSGPGAAELARLRQELEEANGTIKQWEESWKQAKQVLGPTPARLPRAGCRPA